MTAFEDAYYVMVGAKVQGDPSTLESQFELELQQTSLLSTAQSWAQQGYVIGFAEHSSRDQFLLMAQRITGLVRPLKAAIRQAPEGFLEDEVKSLSAAGYTISATTSSRRAV